MKRQIAVLTLLASVGCSTTPQADFMDFWFRSKKACLAPPAAGSPVMVDVNGNVIGPAAVPVAAAPAPEQPRAKWYQPFRRCREWSEGR